MIRRLLAVARRLRPASDPRECWACERITPRPTPSQRRQEAAGMDPSCPWCGGPTSRVSALVAAWHARKGSVL